jgi:dihydroorotate dehydrogenase
MKFLRIEKTLRIGAMRFPEALTDWAAKSLLALPPETAHRFSIWALQSMWIEPPAARKDPILRTRLLGIDAPNPLGMAAGFDKNAEAAAALFGLGFGLVEVGTLTPKPQPGNSKPRLFRLHADGAIVNRLGFNNDGLDAAAARLASLTHRPGLLGVNLGANGDSADPVGDFALGVRRMAGLCDYLVINISSPNTPGLRNLQEKAALDRLLGAVKTARGEVAARPALLVKIAPDLDPDAVAAIVGLALDHAVDGLIVSNTTIGHRADLQSAHRTQQGGLSGRPLFAPSTALLAYVYRLSQGKLTLIGVGGVNSAEAAYAKIKAGASAVQLYTALVYAGPGLISRIKHGLTALLQRDGFATVADAVGADSK